MQFGQLGEAVHCLAIQRVERHMPPRHSSQPQVNTWLLNSPAACHVWSSKPRGGGEARSFTRTIQVPPHRGRGALAIQVTKVRNGTSFARTRRMEVEKQSQGMKC